MPDFLKRIWKVRFENDAKHRILLSLFGFLTLCTLGLTLVIGSLQVELTSFIASARTSNSPSPRDEANRTTPDPRRDATPTPGDGGINSTPTPGPVVTPVGNEPYPGAPACPEAAHSNSKFHSLWNPELKCHYDHEHGENPFVQSVNNTFPGFNLYSLLGSVGIGHTNPSSPMENTHKHGGFKWDVTLSHNSGCNGREGVATGVNALVVQYHNFGDYSIEMDSRVHSAVALLRQCRNSNPTDYGYVFVNQHQDYGQRVAPYQGNILPYVDTPSPAFISSREPYFSISCFGPLSPCDRNPSREFMVSRNANTDSTWISEPQNITGSGSKLFGLLFRLRDTYQSLDSSDMTYPFTFAWMCSNDGGKTYSANPGCRWNNSTSRVHEVMGEVPSSWDNLAGFDTDTRVGRVTAEGYVTRFGVRAPSCATPGIDCHPIKMVNAFTGNYGSGFQLTPEKSIVFNPLNLPERDVYFCNGKVCSESSPGAKASGWIGQNN